MLGLQRFAGSIVTHLYRRATYTSNARAASAAIAAPASNGQNSSDDADPRAPTAEGNVKKSKSSGQMVAAAFESLRNENDPTAKSSATAISNIDERIVNAKTVNGLLAITENNNSFSRKHALKIVSILAEWSTINRVKISEFENDTRFLRVCRMLGRTALPKNGANGKNGSLSGVGNNNKRISGFRTDDLNTVLGVAGDDEAAKLIASISLPQMVKVMSTLAQRKRRSTPLLRSLAFNISSASDQLDLKQSADVLYAMSMLNFQDSVLGAKVCADVQAELPKNSEKSAVVGSILTSLGIMRYRDLDILESLTQWLLKNTEICRPQDLSAYFLTAALLNFKSGQLEDVRKKLSKSIVREDFTKQSDWLNYVWSLTMLGIVEDSHLESVLSTDFLTNLQSDKAGLSPTSKMRLLNLNSYAQLCASDYKGALLPADSPAYQVPMAHTKSKQVLVNGMLDALKSLLPASNHVLGSVDSKMGFIIDATCQFDAQKNALPLDKSNQDAIRVALMVVDFHDICHGTHRSASGITNLAMDLLEKSGYQVIPVPYNEFSTSDKLLKRVQYLEAKFKDVLSRK
ncbi:FAST kinase domain-containing protein 4 [Drosophila sulfurigaster albostrigata]|uniref:FAST kinase domain-containing protein 4 n=1 Tax=Drosophila sulfurigaster albostrigata TaxID=89887 RepID=UPI002D21BA61|nr:FAST kinase domain-containing protein 4 [Drosophila sulfurigaster albostrigata]XP_062126612.1 FAST kinase domain-containing protein 4 [Drosophila sulfurigaster albostrigata]XP_062126613.1 FAST kinase domain-containing protein 4 [Drosophila sulfurigaster albostrigata]